MITPDESSIREEETLPRSNSLGMSDVDCFNKEFGDDNGLSEATGRDDDAVDGGTVDGNTICCAGVLRAGRVAAAGGCGAETRGADEDEVDGRERLENVGNRDMDADPDVRFPRDRACACSETAWNGPDGSVDGGAPDGRDGRRSATAGTRSGAADADGCKSSIADDGSAVRPCAVTDEDGLDGWRSDAAEDRMTLVGSGSGNADLDEECARLDTEGEEARVWN
jgi:hypothetical protein